VTHRRCPKKRPRSLDEMTMWPPMKVQRSILKLGIAQRQIRIKCCHKPRKWQTSSPTSITTAGDWIRVKRRVRNLTRYHLATKMGIATALVRSWENGTVRPDIRQLEMAAKFLRFAPANYSIIFRHEPKTEPAVYRTEIEG
jgi:DNA-binding transcriptional regulator YiaG